MEQKKILNFKAKAHTKNDIGLQTIIMNPDVCIDESQVGSLYNSPASELVKAGDSKVEKKEVKQQRPSNSIEALVRASVDKYNTWLVYNYLEMDLLVKILKGRQSNQPWDISFENKVLWALVHSNVKYREVKTDSELETRRAIQSEHNKLIRLFVTKYDQGDQGIFDVEKGESAMFPRALRRLLMPLAGHLEAHIKFPDFFHKMDSNSTSHILSFLTTHEQAPLFSTCKALRERNSEFIKPIKKLLSLVARGEQNEAEKMIKKNPELLLQSGDITDGAWRIFKNITPLQYAVWALDAHMWTMMLPLFSDAVHIHPDNYWFSGLAALQLQALEEKGTAHGRHFDFKPLLDAYAAFLANPSDETWCRIAEAQGLLPDHVIQEYTATQDKSGSELTQFPVEYKSIWSDELEGVSRNFSVQRGRPMRAGVDRDECVYGVRWYRGWIMGPAMIPVVLYGVDWRDDVMGDGFLSAAVSTGSDLEYERSALRKEEPVVQGLCRQRTEELTDLLRRYGVEPSSAAECKSPGGR